MKTKFGEIRINTKHQFEMQRIANTHGKTVLRLKFASFEALELFLIEELIGSDLMKGSASKVIGTTLLIWDR